MIEATPAKVSVSTGLAALWDSTIGKKVAMAISGAILFGYVVLHLWGNLKVFEGPEKLNAYAAFLRTVGDPLFSREVLLWIARVILLAAVVIHIWAAVSLTQRDRAARPVQYRLWKAQQSSYAARTMFWGGIIIALFVVFHILHLTTGTLYPGFQKENTYLNVVRGFQNPLVSAIYIVGIAAVSLHLYHGVWSALQTLGFLSTRSSRFWRNVAAGLAILIFLGNISMPLAVMAGIIRTA